MHDMYTHTEGCTQTFKDHLRDHLASRKQSLSSGKTFVAAPGVSVGVPVDSNMSSAETLKPMNVPLCTCGLPVRDESERLWSGEMEKVPGQMKAAGGPFCECKQRITVIDDGADGQEGGAGRVAPAPAEPKEGKKSSFKSKALNILCSACTGYVAKPKAGGFYPDAE